MSEFLLFKLAGPWAAMRRLPAFRRGEMTKCRARVLQAPRWMLTYISPFRFLNSYDRGIIIHTLLVRKPEAQVGTCPMLHVS